MSRRSRNQHVTSSHSSIPLGSTVLGQKRSDNTLSTASKRIGDKTDFAHYLLPNGSDSDSSDSIPRPEPLIHFRQELSYDTEENDECLQLEFQTSSPKTPLSTHADPRMWDWSSIEIWLLSRDLNKMIPILGPPDAITGRGLLALNIDDLWSKYKNDIRVELEVSNKMEAERDPLISTFLRKLTELKLRAISCAPEALPTNQFDVLEMQRRIKEFTDKWDKILWIEHYEETNNRTPTKEVMSSELEISIPRAMIYLQCYDDKIQFQKKDLDELVADFNVHEDCIIWWYIIISKLKTYPSKALWLIFERIGRESPHLVSLELLQVYHTDLTRFDAVQLR